MRTWCASLMLMAVCASAQEPSGNLSSPMGKPPEARAAAAQPAEPKPAKAGKAAVKVEKIVVAAGVKDREAFGVADVFGPEFDAVYCWTRIRVSWPPAKVRFVWSRDGKQAAAQSHEIKSSGRWWAMKQVRPGDWKVEVRSEAGELLSEVGFRVNER